MNNYLTKIKVKATYHQLGYIWSTPT